MNEDLLGEFLFSLSTLFMIPICWEGASRPNGDGSQRKSTSESCIKRIIPYFDVLMEILHQVEEGVMSEGLFIDRICIK